MAYYRICPRCGAHLDPGEICACGNKDEAALLEQDDPENSETANIITSATQNVNCELAHDLRGFVDANGIAPRDVVPVIRDQFPKFDKTLLSKCMSPRKYGVVLHPDGWAALHGAYPSASFVTQSGSKSSKVDRRRLPCRIYGRLSERSFNLLQQYIGADGYATIQDWLLEQVNLYIFAKERENAEHT